MRAAGTGPLEAFEMPRTLEAVHTRSGHQKLAILLLPVVLILTTTIPYTCGTWTAVVDWLPMPAQLPPLCSPLPGATISVLGRLWNELSLLLLAVSLRNSFFLLEGHRELIDVDFSHACVIGKLLAARSANFCALSWPS